MSNKVSVIHSVVAGTVYKLDANYTRELMALDGTIYVWYGDYTGTSAELILEGMPFPEGALREFPDAQVGVISLAAAGTVKVHEVI